MTFVVSLTHYTPGVRFDGRPWTQVRVEESVSDSGPWTALETQSLTPVDTDPTSPRSRNVTTGLATLETGWYRLVFLDAFGGSQTSTPTFSESVSAFPGTDAAWVRNLLDDVATSEIVTLTGSGTNTTFYVRRPPISNESVAINGTPTTAYSLSNDKTAIIFDAAPALDAQITVSYTRQTFSDAEIQAFIDTARMDFDLPRAYVYQAAILGVDTLLLGAATALDFGAGPESFDMTSVWTRLQQLRGEFARARDMTNAYPIVAETDGSITA